MSAGLLDVDAAANLIGISPKELQKLATDGAVKRQNGMYHAVRLVRDYVGHIMAEAKAKEYLGQAAIAKRLDMSERNLRDILQNLNIDHKTTKVNDIVIAYVRDLREKAAGRGGNDQLNLSKQRAEESAVKTAMMRLDYNRQIGLLVPGEDAALAITDWCSTANREYRSGFSKLKAEIQSVFKVDIPDEMVENIAGPTTKRIQDHAERVGRDLVEGGDDVHAANDDGNG